MPTLHARSLRLLLTLSILVLLAAACGDGDAATSASETEPSIAVASETEPAAEIESSTEPTTASGTEATPAAPANPDSEFCTAVTAFTEAISEEPQNAEEGEAYLSEALTQLDAVAQNAPEGSEATVDDVTAYFEAFDAALAAVDYDIDGVDDGTIAAAAETYAESLGDFEVLVQSECGISLSGA